MFEHCYFITGTNDAVIIVVPKKMPDGDVFTVSVTPEEVTFAADYETFARVPYGDDDIFKRLSYHNQIGVIEYEEEKKGPMPEYITHVAYVQVWGEA
tara:strand:- start:139 stop:429 length:291 start_codon:yes stop_codon:yes gene_type:complete